MRQKAAPAGHEGLKSLEDSRERYGQGTEDSRGICAVVAVDLCLHELARLRALQCLPTPEALLARLRARDDDFSLIVGVVAAYMHERRIATVHGGQ
jgi:hypothetical protein